MPKPFAINRDESVTFFPFTITKGFTLLDSEILDINVAWGYSMPYPHASVLSLNPMTVSPGRGCFSGYQLKLPAKVRMFTKP